MKRKFAIFGCILLVILVFAFALHTPQKNSYSYDELQNILQEVLAELTQRDKLTDPVFANFSGASIDTENGVIIIYLENCSKESVKAFESEILKSRALQFEQGNPGILTSP